MLLFLLEDLAAIARLLCKVSLQSHHIARDSMHARLINCGTVGSCRTDRLSDVSFISTARGRSGSVSISC